MAGLYLAATRSYWMHSEPELVSLNCDPILAAYRPPSRTSLTAAGLDGSFQTPVVPAGGFWEFWSADESGRKPALRENTHTPVNDLPESAGRSQKERAQKSTPEDKMLELPALLL